MTQGWKYFEYDEKDLEIPDFIGIFCPQCDQEIGYDLCPDCNEEELA